jgi:hypothetical protein
LQEKGAEKKVKRIVVMVVSLVLALLAAGPIGIAVAAQGNGGAPVPVDENPVDLPAGAVFGKCDFPVRLQYSGKAKTITLPDGSFISTSPGLKATLTNLDNPENQKTFSITGAFHTTTLENGDVQTVVTGRNLLGDPKAGFVVAVGRFSYVFDSDGNLVQPLTGKGQLIDVCQSLS